MGTRLSLSWGMGFSLGFDFVFSSTCAGTCVLDLGLANIASACASTNFVAACGLVVGPGNVLGSTLGFASCAIAASSTIRGFTRGFATSTLLSPRGAHVSSFTGPARSLAARLVLRPGRVDAGSGAAEVPLEGGLLSGEGDKVGSLIGGPLSLSTWGGSNKIGTG